MATAVVTGAASGIGLACARLLAREGWHVVGLDVNGNVGDVLGEKLCTSSRVRSAPCDVTDEVAVETVIPDLLKGWPMLAGLVNCAGLARDIPMMDTDAGLFRQIMDVNVVGTFTVIRTCVPHMGDGGAIVNMSSVAGLRGSKGRLAYGASKAAVVNMTQVMAMELAPRDIRVNAIAPGPVETAMIQKMHSDADRRRYTGRMFMKRYARPREIAEVAYFLLSDRSSFITGEVIAADGGFLAAGLMAGDG